MRQFKPGQLQTGSLYPISASFALTASYALDAGVVFETGSLVTTASFNAFTASYNTGSFTGSFYGDGSNLTGIVSSKWTGSNPISRESDVAITGSLRTRNTLGSGINTALGQLIYGDTASVDWRNRYLTDSSDITSIDWQLRKANDSFETPSIDWGSRGAWDSNNAVSIDWDIRQLIKSDESTITVDWENGLFTGSLHGTASWAEKSITASHALTASYVNPLNQNVIITGSIYIQDNAHSIYFSGSSAASRLVWNDTDGTLDLGLKGGNVTLQIGQEQVVRVINKTGANLLESEYKVARIRRVDEGGAQGQRLAIVLAQGNNDANSVDTLGIVTENIDDNQEGFITNSGLVRNINTTGTLQGETWTDGDVLYLSPTIPGALTTTKPQAPDHTVVMGYVVYAHNNQGKIFVKVDNGYEIDELHNVRITTASLTPGQLLVRSGSAATGVWINTNQLTGSYGLTGSLNATSFTGSLLGTASQALNANNSNTIDIFSFSIPVDSYLLMSNVIATTGVSVGGDTDLRYNSSTNTLSAVNISATNLTGSLLGTSSYSTQALSSSYASLAGAVDDLDQNVYISGSLTVVGNATFIGSASFLYITASQLALSSSFISVNIYEPAERFGGLKVYDSGSMSHQATASLAWDSLHNHWVYQNASGSTYSGGMLLSGPRNTGSLGDEPTLTKWYVARSDGGDHLNNTEIYSSGSTTIVYGSLQATQGVTASFTGSYIGDGAGLYNIPASGITGLNLSQIASGSASASISPNLGLQINTTVTATSFTGSLLGTATNAVSASYAVTASYLTGYVSPFPFSGSALITGSLGVTGSVSITQNITASRTILSSSNGTINGPTLTVYGSGSTQPVFTVQGSSGELFSVTDTLTGDLFTVTDANTDTIFNISSSYEIQLGNPTALSLYTTTTASLGTTPVVVYSLPTASYDGAFFDYTLRSGSNARAGNIMAIWDSTSVNFTETTTTDFGDTSGVTLLVAISGSVMALSGSATTNGWNLRTIVRSI